MLSFFFGELGEGDFFGGSSADVGRSSRGRLSRDSSGGEEGLLAPHGVEEFVAVQSSLAPLVKVLGLIGFQENPFSEGWVEGSLELLYELDVGGVGFFCRGVDGEACFSSV
jgi:hypothetical protein